MHLFQCSILEKGADGHRNTCGQAGTDIVYRSCMLKEERFLKFHPIKKGHSWYVHQPVQFPRIKQTTLHLMFLPPRAANWTDDRPISGRKWVAARHLVPQLTFWGELILALISLESSRRQCICPNGKVANQNVCVIKFFQCK